MSFWSWYCAWRAYWASDAKRRDTPSPSQKDSPFLLVVHGDDGLWYVHERRFDTSGVPFQERQDACDYASQRARTYTDSMVLIREHPGPLVVSRSYGTRDDGKSVQSRAATLIKRPEEGSLPGHSGTQEGNR